MSTNGERLGEYVLARRTRLDLNQLEVHADGGPSNSTQTDIEKGRLEVLTRSTARKLDKGLRWQPGSARAVWDGGEPIPVEAGHEQYSERDLAKLRTMIGSAAVDDALRQRLLAVLDEGDQTA